MTIAERVLEKIDFECFVYSWENLNVSLGLKGQLEFLNKFVIINI